MHKHRHTCIYILYIYIYIYIYLYTFNIKLIIMPHSSDMSGDSFCDWLSSCFFSRFAAADSRFDRRGQICIRNNHSQTVYYQGSCIWVKGVRPHAFWVVSIIIINKTTASRTLCFCVQSNLTWKEIHSSRMTSSCSVVRFASYPIWKDLLLFRCYTILTIVVTWLLFFFRNYSSC